MSIARASGLFQAAKEFTVKCELTTEEVNAIKIVLGVKYIAFMIGIMERIQPGYYFLSPASDYSDAIKVNKELQIKEYVTESVPSTGGWMYRDPLPPYKVKFTKVVLDIYDAIKAGKKVEVSGNTVSVSETINAATADAKADAPAAAPKAGE